MSAASQLTELTACPRCDKSPLSVAGDAYRCSGCKTDFPSIADIPWLFAEPDASLGEWRNRLHFALQQLSNEAKQLTGELKADTLSALSRQRLEKQLKAADEHRSTLRQILAPVDIQSAQASYESYLALRTRLPTDQGISTYYGNIHRDWAWGDEENAASLAQISAVTDGGTALGKTLVLGAGACRLAYDIHTELDTTSCVAMDFNPLLLLIAKTVMQGAQQELYEFPIAPRTIDDVAVLRTLSAPITVDDRFHLVLGDALRPPFAKGEFDTVVTPWLIDIVDDDLMVQAARINQLLKPGGRWINFGSLAFTHANQARCYSTEETLDLVEKSGFGAPQVKEENIPYMCSPASRHGRRETVLTFAAPKTDKVKAPARHKALPDWIVTARESVPLSPSFRNQAMSTQIYSFIMSLIDGKRTINDMAKILEQQKLMTAEEAVPAIRTFLTRMYDDSQRSSGF
ncbi:MAG: methyltransferase domain-containing protein [Woeseiaceae bacterium]